MKLNNWAPVIFSQVVVSDIGVFRLVNVVVHIVLAPRASLERWECGSCVMVSISSFYFENPNSIQADY